MLLAAPPQACCGGRPVGPGVPGYARTWALGPLPASLSFPSNSAVSWTDWLGSGLDLTAAYAVDGSTVVLKGPDVSTLSGVRPVSHDAAHGTASFLPFGGYPPDGYGLSAARLSMRGGDLVESWSGVFGRAFADTTSSLELAGGSLRADGPGATARFDNRPFSARLRTVTSGGWNVRARGLRMAPERVRRFEELEPSELGSRRVAGAGEVILEGGRATIALFSGSRRVEDDRAGVTRTGELGLVGASLRIETGRVVEAVDVSVGHIGARGALFQRNEDVWSAAASVSRALEALGGTVSLRAGAVRRRGLTLPEAEVAWSTRIGRRRLDARALVVSRHPSVVERLAVPLMLPSADGVERTVAGRPDLDPEGAVALLVSIRDSSFLSGAGLELGAARLVDPVELSIEAGRPANAPDETTGSASLWVEAGGRAAAGWRLDATLLASGEESSLIAGGPSPAVSASAEGWFHASFFARGYLRTRWSAVVTHESGLARGPWEGAVEDASSRLDLEVRGRAGSAAVYAVVRDVLETEHAGTPLVPAAGRRLEAGFTWTFRG
ncbi:MAG: hypothetical protein GF405_03800 [Candidatus Eisenbacteria bacterium]|nr:hypothetical protein [Candidatus Eisenbacteria bacterium]